MATDPILFNQTPDQLRRIGARGGRARGRTRQRAVPPTALLPASPAQPPVETTAQAIATLEAQFSWLRLAGKRQPRR